MYRDTRNIYCAACGYNLRDQCSGECPECGNAYDRGNGSGYTDKPISAIKRFFANNSRLLLGASFLAFSMAYLWLYQKPTGELRHLISAIAYVSLAIVGVLLHFLKSPPYKG